MSTQAQRRRFFRDLDKREAGFAKKIEPFLKGLYDHYFRCEIKGWENLPDGTSLYVGNHNGLLTFEVLMLFYGWHKKYGTTKKALGLAHSVALDNPFFRWIIPKLGAIPADPEIAREALSRDYSLLVYPGGEKEAFRPYKDRKKIDFYGRKGFIKLARDSKVPLVPIVSVGAHESYVILHRGEELAKKMGLYDRFRLHGVPITFRSLFFMWCVVTGVFTFFPLLLAPAAFFSIFVPMPAKMTFHILPPVDVWAMLESYSGESISEEEKLSRVYDHILGVMQTKLTEEYDKRRFPIIG